MATEKIINTSIRIADLQRIPLSIPISEQEFVREVEENINELWRKWSSMERFKDKSSAEILAMVTFRYAQLYYSVMDASKEVDDTLKQLDKSLSRLLLDTGAQQ